MLNTCGIANPVERISITTDVNSASTIWTQLECCGCYTPYQSRAWYDAWTRLVAPQSGQKPLIITAFDGWGSPSLLLPLVTCSRFSANVASFPGGKHANFKMPVFRKDVASSTNLLERVLTAAIQLKPDVDLYAFDSLPASWNGVPNPFVTADARLHTAAGLVLPLVPDPGILFQNILSPKRLRKMRAIDKRFDQLGFECCRADSSLETEKALATYLEQKAPWFLARGIENPFREPGIVPFLTDLATNPKSGFEIYCLRAKSGYIAAVASILVGAGRASLMFMSHDYNSPVARLSPGNKLVREIIYSACRRRLVEFDFGLGEAAHKVALGAKREVTYTVLRPQSPRGRLAAALFEGERRAKIAAKSHPFVMSGIFLCKGALDEMFRPGRRERTTV